MQVAIESRFNCNLNDIPTWKLKVCLLFKSVYDQFYDRAY